MKKIFELADRYVAASDWRDLALLKFCLCAIGILIGTAIPEKKRKLPMVIAGIIFVVTYVPLMLKLARVASDGEN